MNKTNVLILENQAAADNINRLLESYTERDRRIVALRIGIEDGERHSLQYIGDQVGLSREGVRLIVQRFSNQLDKLPGVKRVQL